MKKYKELHEILRVINGFPPRLKKLYKDRAPKKDIDPLEEEYNAVLVALEDTIRGMNLPRGQVAN